MLTEAIWEPMGLGSHFSIWIILDLESNENSSLNHNIPIVKY